MIEASDVAHLGDEAHGGHKGDPAQRLERVYHGRPPPGRRQLPELLGEPLDAAFGFVDRVAVLLQRHVLRGERETEIRQPPAIGAGPSRAPRVAVPLPEEKRLQPMLRLRRQADRVLARAAQIAQGFIVGGGGCRWL